MTRGRIVAGVGVVAAVAFGFWGGEYGTQDWWTLRQEIAAQEAALNRLYVEIDSLEALADAVESDSATQEREARERFGMLRDGELLFSVPPAP